MNFYNPFKPHIVRNSDGSYSVRKLTFPFLFEKYLEQDMRHYSSNSGEPRGFYWWSIPQYVMQYCKYTAPEAYNVLVAYQQAIKPKAKSVYIPLKDILK